MQQIETHFERALALGTDSDEAWLHIETLRKIGTDDVFRIASEFCRSSLASKRSLGVCSEAFVGLARRADLRVIPYLCNELCSDRVGQLAVESAKILARPELVASLEKLSKWWDVDAELLADALAACSRSLDESVNHSDDQS